MLQLKKAGGVRGEVLIVGRGPYLVARRLCSSRRLLRVVLSVRWAEGKRGETGRSCVMDSA